MDASVRKPHSVLSVEGLSVSYRAKPILKNVNMTIDPGDVFGLLGPNGAGKTTLIRTICARIRPRSGQVLIEGKANSRREALRKIGLVPQEIALYPHLSARENLMVFARLAGLSRSDSLKAIDYAIDACRLSEQVDDQVHTLSGGWKRRANIAAAILHRPSLLILDEPTVGVDIDARNALHEVIKDLSIGGLSVLLSTHDMDQAEALCGSVGFLRKGVLAPVGDPGRLLDSAFGDRQEVLVRLREPASPEICEILSELGFSNHRNGLERRQLLKATAAQQTRLTKTLEESQLRIKEIRFRKPGLDSLFLKIKAEGHEQ
ncbi:MAG: ABC transporter ATP-binding protein [Pseudomonadota bacterium]